jgi:phage gp37-like protein
MTDATTRLRDTKDIIDALVQRLQDLTLSDEETAPAFEKVEVFDLADWEDALRRLALNQQRSAIVIWAGEDWEHNRETVVLTSKRSQSFEIMISERRLDKPVAALTGDDRSPGVVGLKDRVVKKLTGVLLAGDGTSSETIYTTVQNVQRGVLSMEDKKKEPGRQLLILSTQAQGEWLQTAVDANPNY